MANFSLNGPQQSILPEYKSQFSSGSISNPYGLENFNAINAVKDTRFVNQINGQFFNIEIWMYNGLKKFKPVAIPFFFVNELLIEDSINEWNVKGYITIVNDYELLERKFKDDEMGSAEAPFLLRTDGRNKLSIKISPVTNDKESLPREIWEMSYDFVIYDIEDLETESASKKLRRFYFWDERFQILLERNLEWSTAVYGPNNGNLDSHDIERAMPASEAIKSIIKTAASNSSNPTSKSEVDKKGSEEVKIGFSKESSVKLDLNTTTLPGLDSMKSNDTEGDLAVFDDKRWDSGVEGDDGKVLYTSPSNACALDDLNYVYSYMKAKDGSPLFLKLDRYGDNQKAFTLVSLQDYIKDADKNQIERIVLRDNVDNSEKAPKINRAPEGSFQSAIASIIDDYRLVTMTPKDDMNLIANTPLSNYNFKTGAFNIYKKDNFAKDLVKKMTDICKLGLHSFKVSDAQVGINLNKTKTSGLRTKNAFTARHFFPKDIVGVSMIKNFMLLTQCLNFKAPGLTARQPGKFIFVDTDSSDGIVSPFEDKFLGQWFLTKVTHHFTKESYSTDVVAVKPDMFRKWFDQLDENY
jgi:hypothetical protein